MVAIAGALPLWVAALTNYQMAGNLESAYLMQDFRWFKRICSDWGWSWTGNELVYSTDVCAWSWSKTLQQEATKPDQSGTLISAIVWNLPCRKCNTNHKVKWCFRRGLPGLGIVGHSVVSLQMGNLLEFSRSLNYRDQFPMKIWLLWRPLYPTEVYLPQIPPSQGSPPPPQMSKNLPESPRTGSSS